MTKNLRRFELENPAEEEVENAFYEFKSPAEDIANKIENKHVFLLRSFLFSSQNARQSDAAHITHYTILRGMLQGLRSVRNLFLAAEVILPR